MRPNTVVASWSLSFYDHVNYYIKNVMLNFMVLIYKRQLALIDSFK